MRRTRLVALVAAFAALAGSAFAQEDCGCTHNRVVLNGHLNTYDFDGGVGDRFGDGGASGGGATIVYGGASAGGYASAGAHASAFASASASTHVFSFTSFHGGMHGGGMHAGGGHH